MKCPKCMIPGKHCCETIVEIKKASQDTKSKSQLEYYLLAELVLKVFLLSALIIICLLFAWGIAS